MDCLHNGRRLPMDDNMLDYYDKIDNRHDYIEEAWLEYMDETRQWDFSEPEETHVIPF